jgi:hypothetical protein
MWNITPIIGTTFYIYVSRLLKYHFQNNSNKNYIIVNYFSILHNIILASFSFYTFISLCKIINDQGIYFGNNMYMSQPYIKNLIFWFYISKYYEYFDTFLLYVKGREPIFLQKYHHIGAVVCWHLCYKYNVDAVVFGTIFNSCVHSIMYSYYLMTIFKLNIRGMRMYITSGQMIQLVFGGLYGLYYYYPPVENMRNYSIIVFFNLYIVGLIYLFAKFMVINYCKNPVKKII